MIKACLYDPQVNRSYAEMARHYSTTCLPTRPRRPRDKAKVEACVGIVEPFLGGYSRYGLFALMDGETYFRGSGLPWLGLLASAGASAAMLYAATRNIARRDF